MHNKFFRDYVAQFQDSYVNGNDTTKNKIVERLIDWVQSRDGGRFLDQDSSGWFEVPEKAARNKVRQLIREMHAPKSRKGTERKK
jgi:hypothetical protein